MDRMSARGAGKAMTGAFANQSAPAALLAGIGRIDIGHHHPSLLRLALSSLPNETALPDREATARGFAAHLALGRLRHGQRLKDEDGACGCPCNQLLARRVGKGAGAVGLLATEPFEQ